MIIMLKSVIAKNNATQPYENGNNTPTLQNLSKIVTNDNRRIKIKWQKRTILFSDYNIWLSDKWAINLVYLIIFFASIHSIIFFIESALSNLVCCLSISCRINSLFDGKHLSKSLWFKIIFILPSSKI